MASIREAHRHGHQQALHPARRPRALHDRPSRRRQVARSRSTATGQDHRQARPGRSRRPSPAALIRARSGRASRSLHRRFSRGTLPATVDQTGRGTRDWEGSDRWPISAAAAPRTIPGTSRPHPARRNTRCGATRRPTRRRSSARSAGRGSARRAGDRRPARDAQGQRRLGAARRSRRAEAGSRGDGRGVGPPPTTRSAAGTA